MDDLLKLILEIEKRPALWIGSTDTRFLRHFLSGYCYAKSGATDGYRNWLFEDFRNYLAEKYEDVSTLDWSGLIIENEADGNSTDTFYRLLHEFLEKHPL
jgi:hypothetical protein